VIRMYKENGGNISELFRSIKLPWLGKERKRVPPLATWRFLTILAEAHNDEQMTLKKKHEASIEDGRELMKQGLPPYRGVAKARMSRFPRAPLLIW